MPEVDEVCTVLAEQFPMFKNTNFNGLKEIIRASLKSDERFQVNDSSGRISYVGMNIIRLSPQSL